MTSLDRRAVRDFLSSYVSDHLASRGRELHEGLDDGCDLLLSGIIDSLGLLELMTALQDHFGQEIDFDSLDPDHMTVVGPLCDFVSNQLANQ